MRWFWFALLILLCSGCSVSRAPETKIAMGASPREVERVAVLPFDNLSPMDTGGILAYRIFLNELVSSGLYEVEGEGASHLFLERNRLFPSDPLDSSLYAGLARQLQVDAVIRGKVIDMGVEKVAAEGAFPFASLQIEMVDARTGRSLLTTFYRRSGEDYRKIMHFGLIQTMSRLVASMSREILDDWKKEVRIK